MNVLLSLFIALFCTNAFGGFAELNPRERADIIFIVDDSGSMAEHQKNLSNNVESILAEFKDMDSHIGILNTSARGLNGDYTGRFLGRPVKGSFSEKMSIVAQDLMVGIRGNATEVPFKSLFMALSDETLAGENKGFLRTNTPLYIIFITDTEDQSDFSSLDIFKRLTELKAFKAIKIYGFLADSTKGCMGERVEPIKIRELIQLTGGKEYSLCDPDWSINVIHR